MKLRDAIRTTFEDWLTIDREMSRWLWIIGTVAITPVIPFVIVYRAVYGEPP